MTALIRWLSTISPAHFLLMVTLGVLLGLGIGPQETELALLVGAAGLSINTSTTPIAAPAATPAKATPVVTTA